MSKVNLKYNETYKKCFEVIGSNGNYFVSLIGDLDKHEHSKLINLKKGIKKSTLIKKIDNINNNLSNKIAELKIIKESLQNEN